MARDELASLTDLEETQSFPAFIVALTAMNGYLRSKCSSEQQLLNELAKLLGAKDVASRKMADVLRALTFFYTSAARGSRIPQSLLSGLCSLMPQLKDKKEMLLLKDEHQRIARIALCLLARLIDQFEIQREMAARLTDSQKLSQEQSVDPSEQVLSSFLVTLETAVTTPTGLLLPRQRATLRVYAQLCRVFRKREQLVTYATTLLQQSSVLAENAVDAKGKKVAPPGPAQFGAVAGACHALRFHTVQDEQVFAVDKLVQLAFTMPSGTASRHAAKTLLSLLTSSSLNEDRPSNAVTTAKAIELYLLKARPRTLLGGDSLTSVYLLRLCGQMYRLPVHQQQQQQLGTSLSTQQSTENPALEVFFVSNALSAQLQEYLADVVQDAVTDGMVPPAVLLVAIEEVLRGTSPETSFRKQPNRGSACIFELEAAALLSLLPTPAKPVSSTVTLHRVCRAVQFVAERLDTNVLQLGASSGQPMVIPAYLSNITTGIRSLTEHSNAFVACEALRAYVWLLPRSSTSAEQNGTIKDEWTNLFWQLEALPFNRIQPERRAAIAWTLFRRCVTTPKSYGYAVETRLLAGCLRIVLAWFRMRPCVWQAALLTAIWHTALRECLAPLGNAVFSSIIELLDFQCAPTDNAAPDSLVVKQSAIQFLSHREGGMRYAVRNEAWSSPLLLRLTKQALLEICTSQRLSTRALSQLRDEAQLQGCNPLSQQVNSTLGFLQKTSRQSATGGDDSEKQEFSFHDEPFSDTRANGAIAATNDDPFSDIRARDEAIRSTESRTLEDPFADAVASSFVTTSDFTISDFNAPAQSSFNADSWSGNGVTDEQSAFESWGDGNISQPTFTADDSAFESAFTSWPEPQLSSGLNDTPTELTPETTTAPSTDALTDFSNWNQFKASAVATEFEAVITSSPENPPSTANCFEDESIGKAFDSIVAEETKFEATAFEATEFEAGITSSPEKNPPSTANCFEDESSGKAFNDSVVAEEAEFEAAEFEATEFEATEFEAGSTSSPEKNPPSTANCFEDESSGKAFDDSVVAEATEFEATGFEAGITSSPENPPSTANCLEDESSGKAFDDSVVAEETEFEAVITSSENPSANAGFDDEFDEIFGDAPVNAVDTASTIHEGAIGSPEVAAQQDKYDEEFDDIFGNAGQGQTNSDTAASNTSPSIDNTDNEAITIKHNTTGDEDQTVSGVEVRTGTRASDFSFR
ncbi:hypothetical protein PF008_g9727 [Phytophthora fragariae]|uniref:Uncharacterized protein n=1 Tax=Phytophthora fragariae TaxID=53985 RepID=A0A6G0RVY5_9STRA|nr:hypothetical protein PF008_g9727 [Phytophthora fragariae]